MIIALGVETSCDDTSCAVVREDGEALSNVVSSQTALHAKYGGVVPEIASRAHTERIMPVLDQALDEAGVALEDVDFICATKGPGLIGSLLVGLETAKGLAYAARKPLIPVNHIAGHLHSIFVGEDRAQMERFYPYLGLIVSGGHSSLVRCDAPGSYRELGVTLDDASGEVFDKVAQMLELGHPGGPIIDRLARDGDPHAFKFPRPVLTKAGYNFSFSGLKTAVRLCIEERGLDTILASKQMLADICASFQMAVVDVLLTKAERALKRERLERLAIVGGVACNGCLRQAARERLNGSDIRIPKPLLCTDNAAMVAAIGLARRKQDVAQDWAVNADSNLRLGK
ncbi:tRNA (adenosine(37)-N6)-threonylcarbamoyltransferase complex transferase subunit TsaD [Candidatus Sumerlaeota bacterium]|nr:tRNA (adenosine(37)-N6)-threonylcarbamoyltransferase complex transferase subunit TsaD [Candidatus Sumerlaeota bacterium]